MGKCGKGKMGKGKWETRDISSSLGSFFPLPLCPFPLFPQPATTSTNCCKGHTLEDLQQLNLTASRAVSGLLLADAGTDALIASH